MYLDTQSLECPPTNKIQFIGSTIFGFTTYDDEIDEIFAKCMLEVCECILNGTSTQYQNTRTKYFNYLTMVNMPFLVDKLDWGTSIRGAWFDEYGHASEPKEYYIDLDFSIPKSDIKKFIKALLEWSKEK